MHWRKEERQANYNGHGHNRRHRHRHGSFISITELKPGQEGIVASIQGNLKVVKRLADLGLTPETNICILKAAPLNGPIEVAVRGSKLAIGRDIAENIFVRVEES